MSKLFHVLVLLVVVVLPLPVAGQLKEIRMGSSNISVTNLASFYARDRRFFEAEGFDVKMIIVKTEAALPALEPQNNNDMTSWIGRFFKLDDRMSDEFYRRLVPSPNASGIVERDKIKLVIDSAIERGLTDKPRDPDAVSDFSIVRQLRF